MIGTQSSACVILQAFNVEVISSTRIQTVEIVGEQGCCMCSSTVHCSGVKCGARLSFTSMDR